MSGSLSTTAQSANKNGELSAFLEEYGIKISRGRKKSFSILLVGRTGVGKSSIVNSLVGEQISPVGAYEPTTMSITSFNIEAFNNRFTIIDTPGLCNDLEEKNNDKMYIELLRPETAKIDCLMFVTPLYETRITMDEKRAIKLISDGWGKEIWNQAIIVFTFANSIRIDNYHEAFVARTRLIQQEIARWTTLSIAENIPSVATDSKAITTPDGQQWREQLYLTLFDRSLDRRSRLREKDYSVLVIGEFNRGKSSFVNALIGQKILPTGDDPTSASVFRIRRADTEAYRVRFEDGTLHSIRKEDLASYGERSKTDSISLIEVDITSDSLPKGIEILDTPGLGSLSASHASITQRFVPGADAVIFILDSRFPMTREEKDFIRMLLDVMEKPNILFIQTQIDLFSEEEWQLIRQRNEQMLLTEFGNRLLDARVWPISNRLLLEIGLESKNSNFEQNEYKELQKMLTNFLGRISGYTLGYEEMPLISPHDKEQTKHVDEDLQLTLFAITRTSFENDMAIVDNIYSVQAGLSQSKPENANPTSPNLAIYDTNEQIGFDILVHASENIKLTTERYKILNYNPRLLEPQFVEFSFQPRASGHCVLDVHFYHEQRWLTSTQIEFEASEKLQLSAPSSGDEFSFAQTRRARLTYGIGSNEEFDPSIDPLSKRYWDENLGRWLCQRRFLVLVRAGEAINPGQIINRTFILPANQDRILFSFYETSQKQVRYTDEKHVKELGTIILSRGDIDLRLNLSVEVKAGFDMPSVEDEASIGSKTGDIVLAWIEASVVDERSGNRTSHSRFEITS